MSASILRRQAEACARTAEFMSDPQDRDRILQSRQTLLELAGEEEARRDILFRSK